MIITTDYVKRRISEALNKVTQNFEGQEQSVFFKADKVFMKLLKALHSLYTFYNKPRESCQYMLGTLFNLQEYKYPSHVNILNILEIEQYLLSLIMVVTRSFDNPEKYNFYIKENDIYNILKRKSNRDDEFGEFPNLVTPELTGRLFAKNTAEGKYVIKLKDLEAFSAKNEAQIKLFHRCGEFVPDLEEIIDFCVFFHLYDLAIHVCITHNLDPVTVVHQMVYQYCEKYRNAGEENKSEDGLFDEYQFEDPHYGWEVNDVDRQTSECDLILKQAIEIITHLKTEYPNLRTQAFEALLANFPDMKELDKGVIDKLGKGVEIDGAFDLSEILKTRLR